MSMVNPGLAPWAMQEYRPYRAPLRLLPVNIFYYFDAVVLVALCVFATSPLEETLANVRLESGNAIYFQVNP